VSREEFGLVEALVRAGHDTLRLGQQAPSGLGLARRTSGFGEQREEIRAPQLGPGG